MHYFLWTLSQLPSILYLNYNFQILTYSSNTLSYSDTSHFKLLQLTLGETLVLPEKVAFLLRCHFDIYTFCHFLRAWTLGWCWREKMECILFSLCLMGTAYLSTPKTDCKENEAASNNSDYDIISKHSTWSKNLSSLVQAHILLYSQCNFF